MKEFWWIPIRLICFCVLLLATSPLQAQEPLKIRVIGQAEGTSNYYHDLLKQALTQAGHPVELDIRYDIPQKRYIAMFEHGLIDVVWLLKSAERNQKYQHVDIDLTNGLLGQRVLMIPSGTGQDYAGIWNLEDFRKSGKVGAFGTNWFDIDVWKANNLPYVVLDGDWRRIYNLLLLPRPRRNTPPFDYFSRGVSEISYEISIHPSLKIEPHLLFIYDRDFIFYISDKSKYLQPIIEQSLHQAQASGLMQRLFKHYFSEPLANLNLNKRVRLNLKTPK